VLVSATARAVNWKKFDGCRAMFLCRLQKNIAAVTRELREAVK
jgi:hypothetical protein